MNYHQLLRGLDMFKFNMIGDDSFNHLNERMMVPLPEPDSSLGETESGHRGANFDKVSLH